MITARQRYINRKNRGVCTRCGRHPVTKGLCLECKRKTAIRMRKYMRKRYGFRPQAISGIGRPCKYVES